MKITTEINSKMLTDSLKFIPHDVNTLRALNYNLEDFEDMMDDVVKHLEDLDEKLSQYSMNEAEQVRRLIKRILDKTISTSSEDRKHNKEEEIKFLMNCNDSGRNPLILTSSDARFDMYSEKIHHILTEKHGDCHYYSIAFFRSTIGKTEREMFDVIRDKVFELRSLRQKHECVMLYINDVDFLLENERFENKHKIKALKTLLSERPDNVYVIMTSHAIEKQLKNNRLRDILMNALFVDCDD